MPRLPVGRALAVAMLLSAGLSSVGRAQAPAPANPCAPGAAETPLVANGNQIGVIDLAFVGLNGAPVSYYECVGERAIPLGERTSAPGTITVLSHATLWRCGRLSRHFAATSTHTDGSPARGVGSLRTMSCAHRFMLDVPLRVTPGHLARIRITDRWRVGSVRLKLCVTAPRTHSACRAVPLAAKSGGATIRMRLATSGHWRLQLRAPHARVDASIAVGVPTSVRDVAPPAVLATGDSTMDGIDSFLADDLGSSASFHRDVRPGFAISRADGWEPIATAQTRKLHQNATVISIGANEGFPMRAADGAEHACCDEPWVAEYARRVRQTMITYRRAGRARVFWLTIQAPRDPRRVPTFDAVNQAILRAAQGLAGVRVLRMDQLFSPHGYQPVIHYKGHDVRVREPDGIHLNVAGTKIAAAVVAQALREH